MSLVWAIREGFSKEATDQQRPERWDGGQGGERGLLLMGADGGPPQLLPSQSLLSLELTSSDRPRDMAGRRHVTTQSSNCLMTPPPRLCPARAQDESALGTLQMEGPRRTKNALLLGGPGTRGWAAEEAPWTDTYWVHTPSPGDGTMSDGKTVPAFGGPR